MSVDFVSLTPNMNVGEAIDSFRISDDLPIEFYEIYLVDGSSKPIAAISLSNIIRSSRDKSLKDLESHELIKISAEMDRELVAYQFERFDLVSAPVIDDQGSLIGVITADDIVEVFKDEAGEDIRLLGGVGDEDITDSVIETSRSRFSWLFVNLITAVIASIVIGIFDRTIEEMVALAILMPIVASMGGNAGTQTLTITVRSLSTRDLIPLNYKRIINREILVSFLNGLLFAIILGILSALWFSNPALGLVLAIAMILNMVTAGFAGIIIPLILNKVGIDPALASSVFVTTVTDVVGFLVFLGLAALFLV
jgi:magnesium transporter